MVRVPGHPASASSTPSRSCARRASASRSRRAVSTETLAVHLRHHPGGQGPGLRRSSTCATSSRPAAREEGRTHRITAAQWRELADFILDDVLAAGAARRASSTTSARCPRSSPTSPSSSCERGYDVSHGLDAPQDRHRLPGGQGPHEHQLRGRHHALPVRAGLDHRQRARHDACRPRCEELFKLRQHEVTRQVRRSATTSRICYGLPHQGVARRGRPVHRGPDVHARPGVRALGEAHPDGAAVLRPGSVLIPVGTS